jgi:NADPH:quinone reductase
VLVRVHTSGVNFIDVYYREGKYKAPLPFTPGGEGSGHVEALGEGVTDLSVGDSVAWWGPLGSYAEKAIVAAKTLVKVPSGVDLQSAAALIVQGATACYLSHLTFELKPGNMALVHAAAGGVGCLLTQNGKKGGCHGDRDGHRLRKGPSLHGRLARRKSFSTLKQSLTKK